MNAEKNRVAAVVVTYKRLPLLKKCIEHLRGQTAPCDILVVNNASADGTGPWLTAQQAAGVLTARDTGENLDRFGFAYANQFSYGMYCYWCRGTGCSQGYGRYSLPSGNAAGR